MEDFIDRDNFTAIKSPSLTANSYTSIIATRKDASAEIKLNYFDPAWFYKERTFTIYPDYYEVYLSRNTPDNWEMIRTVDTSFINKSFIIKGLSNNELYYVYLKEVSGRSKETKITNVAVFIPSQYQPIYSFLLSDYNGNDLYTFDINSSNNEIVYASKYYEFKPGYSAASIFISDSGNEPQLVDYGSWFPAFNSSGEKISYSSDKGEMAGENFRPEHIAVYDLGTKTSTRLTSGYSVNRYPSWSPVKYSIAFSTSEKSDLSLRIALLDPASGTFKILQTGSEFIRDLISYSQERPAWSADGEYIYYTQRTYTNANMNPGYFDIYRLKSAGGVPEPVFNSDRIECSPSISPDNSKLAFLSDLSGKLQIWVYNFANKKFSQPFTTTDYDFSEYWSQIKWKDSNTVFFTAYSKERGGDFSLYSITVE